MISIHSTPASPGWRLSCAFGAALAAGLFASLDVSHARAQAAAASTPPKSTTNAAGDEVLQLTPFSVTADADTGYIARDSLAGSRLNTALKDTPASLSVLTKEFLEDIGATTLEEAMAWSTNSQMQMQDTLTLASTADDVNSTFFNFPAFRVRGLPATNTKNYFSWELPSDIYNSERVEEARGPNSILFGIGSAGGVVNTMTKRATFGRDFRSATVGISSFGGYRGTVDVNERVSNRLAVRFNGVYDKTKSFRNFVFGKKQLAHFAATYKITDRTTLRGEYETGLIRDNVASNQQATDQYGNWVAGGSQLITTPIATTQHSAFGVSRMAATTRMTLIGNTDTLVNAANQYTTTGDDFAFPPHIVPYKVAVGGPGTLRRPHFDQVNLALEHQFGRSTFVELAYAHQQYNTWNQQLAGGRVFVDPNVNLPNGQPNPNAGRPYVEAESWAWDYALRSDITRLSVAQELDGGKWGKYRFAAMGEYEWRSPRTAQMFEVWDGAPYHATPENAANVVYRRQYVTFGDWDNFHLESPAGYGLVRGLTDPSGLVLNSTWVPRNPTALRDNPQKQKSVLLATQARFFKERLVLGLGYRLDKLDTVTRGTTRTAAGLHIEDYGNNTFASYEGKTKTLGAVYHLTPKFSVFYNMSDNFGLPPTIFLVPDGKRAGNPEGQGQDYGFAVSLFDGKLVARANYFKTDLVNGANSNYGGTATAPDALGDRILDALRDQGLISASDADSRRVTNTGATYAQLVEGYEFNLTANPTKNWRLQANFSYTDGYTSEVAPEVQAWAAEMIPYFKSFPQGTSAGNTTIGSLIRDWEEYNNGQLELVGLTLPGNRKYKTNIFTSYSFSEGFLKGLRIGGGYKHYSKLPIGQYADKSLQYGPSYGDTNLMVGYRFGRLPVEFIKRLNLQLNVTNPFEGDDDAYVFRRSKTSPERIQRIRVRDVRVWRLTASFDF
jgi:outer membrane receptor protein involved in Fe transport